MSVFGNVAFDHHQHVAFAEDRAIIAVHNTQLGPVVAAEDSGTGVADISETRW